MTYISARGRDRACASSSARGWRKTIAVLLDYMNFLGGSYENHIRASTGRPLGATTVTGAAAMLNLIGDFPDLTTVLKQPGVHLHHYGKSPRAGRKIGHLTLVAPDHATLFRRITALRAAIGLAKQLAWTC